MSGRHGRRGRAAKIRRRGLAGPSTPVAEIDEHLEHPPSRGREWKHRPSVVVEICHTRPVSGAPFTPDVAARNLPRRARAMRATRRLPNPAARRVLSTTNTLRPALAGGVVHAHRVDLRAGSSSRRAEGPHRRDAGGFLSGVVNKRATAKGMKRAKLPPEWKSSTAVGQRHEIVRKKIAIFSGSRCHRVVRGSCG